jgi:hypothetical protein
VEESGGGILVITEGVFGMAGDLGKLDKIAALKKKYNFRFLSMMLMVLEQWVLQVQVRENILGTGSDRCVFRYIRQSDGRNRRVRASTKELSLISDLTSDHRYMPKLFLWQ